MREWVVVAECPNGLWTALLYSYLESQGIVVWVENQYMQALLGNPLFSQVAPNPALGPYRLRVPSNQIDRALRAIQDFFA